MRVGIDATFLQADALYTGMGVYTRGLTSALAALSSRHEIILLGYGARPAAAPVLLSWHRLTQPSVGRLGPWLSHQTVLPRAARDLALDVLHIAGINLRLSQPGVPFRTPCPLVVTMHDAIPLVYYGRQGPPLPWRLRLGYRIALLATRRAAAIITVSETSRRDILAHIPLSPERLHVVYNGLDIPCSPTPQEAHALLARRGIAPPYLLYAGSYEPRKNLLGAIAAYRHALERRDLPPLVLLVERESGHRQATMVAIERYGLERRLVFVHSLPEEELGALYRHAALLIYPSHYEGFGFVPLQALACGVPVISSRAGSLPEVLGDAARYVESTAVDELAATILDLYEQPAATALAARGPAQAARFRWKTMAEQTLAIYSRAAGVAA